MKVSSDLTVMAIQLVKFISFKMFLDMEIQYLLGNFTNKRALQFRASIRMVEKT
jgi:hypothetical protein